MFRHCPRGNPDQAGASNGHMSLRITGLLVPLLSLFLVSTGQSVQSPSSGTRPYIRPDGVLPANSNRVATLAPGMFVSIYGDRLGPEESCTAHPNADLLEGHEYDYFHPLARLSRFAFPRELCGVKVLVDGKDAGILYVHRKQINFKVPHGAPPGTSEVRVVYQGEVSDPFTVRVGPPFLEIFQDEPAFTGMPVWLYLHSLGKPAYEYPPSRFGCVIVEVRRDGEPFPRMPLSQDLVNLSRGIYDFDCIMGFAMPPSVKVAGMHPLHLEYRFDEPGTYEVRVQLAKEYPGFPGRGPPRILQESAWTLIEILPAAPNQRAEWLQTMSAKMNLEPGDLLSDYLPSLLGVPDAETLPLVSRFLHHPDSLIRRYAASGLHYWPEPEVLKELERLMKENGPSDVIVEELALRKEFTPAEAERFLRSVLPYFYSDLPVQMYGAIVAIRNMKNRTDVPLNPDFWEQVYTAVLNASDRMVKNPDPEIAGPYTALVGSFQTPRSHEVLWKMTANDRALAQALIALTWFKDPADLSRITRFLQARYPDEDFARNLTGMCSTLHSAYGDVAMPYVESVVDNSPHNPIRLGCSEQLMLAGDPKGFATALDIFQSSESYRQWIHSFLAEKFGVGFDGGDEQIIAFLRERAAPQEQ